MWMVLVGTWHAASNPPQLLTPSRASAASTPFWHTKADRKKANVCISPLGLEYRRRFVFAHPQPGCPEALDLPEQPHLRVGELIALLSCLSEIQHRPGLPQLRLLLGPINSQCIALMFNFPMLTEHPDSPPRSSSHHSSDLVSALPWPLCRTCWSLCPWQASMQVQKHCSNAFGTSHLLPSLDTQTLVSTPHAYFCLRLQLLTPNA